MKYVKTKQGELSSFMLGTVQLGMEYGLGADRAKPSEEKVFSILDSAMELGINALDTANNYGDSEKVIGNWLRNRKTSGQSLPWVVTKIGPLQHGNVQILRDDILRQTEGCLKTLGVDSIDCLMLHVFDDYIKAPDVVAQTFRELKDQNVCKSIALSAYSYHDYGLIAQSGFDAVQIPLNVFDWGKICDGSMEKLAASGMSVFTRSVFLQGLVFQTPETLDKRMDFAVPYLRRYLQLCEEFGLSPEVLALSFVLSIPGVTAAVLGCDNVQQIKSNCDLFDKTVWLSQSQWAALKAAFCDVDPRLINPGLWYNHT